MKIRFCGAAGTTTGSQHLLEVNGAKILLDCGLYQGRRDDAYRINQHFTQFDPAELDCVVLSHAHIDHSGNLPNLTRSGFSGNIYSTFATRDLCQIMLADSARIHEDDVAYLNRHLREGQVPLTPLYNEIDAEQCMRQFVNIGYKRKINIANGVELSFYDAGHILGSAQVVLDIQDNEDGKRKRLLFSGDVGRGNNELLPDPEAVDNVDYMIMESTYGGIEHESPPRDDNALLVKLREALKRGGKILIPSFAVERTQQLLYVMHRLFKEGLLHEVPVIVDSPLAVSATEVFRLHPECFNSEVYNFMFEKQDAFGFENLRLVRSVQESKEINTWKRQMIIISASGMCEAGRILHHLANGIGNPHNTVLFVGYCAEQTLGWKIRSGFSKVNILGNCYNVRASVETLDSFSGHADHSELLNYFKHTGGAKKRIFLVHGEPERAHALREALQEIHPQGTVEVAEFAAEASF